MASRTPMQHLARWHIWLGWVVGLPILMWTVTGLFMVARPIEEVRGNHLRIEAKKQPIPPSSEIAFALPADKPVMAISAAMEDGQIVTRLEHADGSIARYGENGAEMPPLVARQVTGGDKVASATFFPKDKVPFDFRREMPVWQIVLEDGTHVYVGQQSGKVETVRTRWWRMFDFMWGLHILDPMEREDTSHPILILAAALSVIGALLGSVLLFRRRRAAR
jgi:uncharacterized iron-regulated membrane protein